MLFATDYPHWDFDDPERVRIPPAWRDRILRENARELYRLPRRAAEVAAPETQRSPG